MPLNGTLQFKNLVEYCKEIDTFITGKIPVINMFDFLTDIWPQTTSVITSLYLVTTIFIAVLIVLENRTPVKTISWILVLVLIPIGGIVVYLFFGQEYRKQKMFSRKGLHDLEQLRKLTTEQLKVLHQYKFSQSLHSKKHLMNLLLNNSNSILTNDNEVKLLINGSEKFSELFSEIEKARHHVHLEYYIIDDDETGNYLRELLIRKAGEGVEVRIIYDDVGSWELKRKFIRPMQEAGIKIDCFMKVRFPSLTSRVNYRNHRKIVVIDGQVAFTGGINIADRYLKGIPGIGPWRDTHLKLTGGAATALQIIFMADWYFVSKEVLKGDQYFKPFKAGEGKVVQICASGPDSDWESIHQAYFSAIATATSYVYIASPYLLPTVDLLAAIKIAALSGIDVRILLPDKSDAHIPKWGTESYIEELLEAGVKIYFYKAGFTHSKIIIADGVFSTVGTANVDFRSLETNFEVNAMIYDEEMAAKLTRNFMDDLSHSWQVSAEEWERRPWYRKAKESFARIFSPLL